jgi:hypothetical protein
MNGFSWKPSENKSSDKSGIIPFYSVPESAAFRQNGFILKAACE